LRILFIFIGVFMSDFNYAIVKTIAKEGGSKITDDPNDKGGLTRYGISQRSYPNLDIKNLTESQAAVIYKRDYWDLVRGDDIKNQIVAENIFDTAVNMGVKTASRLAQSCLDISPADGAIGDASLIKINGVTPEYFLLCYTLAKVARYASICNKDRSQSKFLLGWINRALGGV
jgi:lysozyme family protein